MMSRPRVLLVDDDASIRRFVSLALDDLDVTLIACASVAEALAALREAPVHLLLTDLMMPGESGLDLLQRLVDEPALRGSARQVVFSAGLDAATRERLGRFDIWRQLRKPVSVVELEACVRAATVAGPAAGALSTCEPVTASDEGGLGDNALAAVATHFAGDRTLFLAFRQSCLTQFRADLVRGDDSLRRQDLADLRHLSHSLKSVLTLLGESRLAETARELERCAEHAEADRALALWSELRSGLGALLTARA